jgi:pimeloyl-ACP methyl ester carboxylesterase
VILKRYVDLHFDGRIAQTHYRKAGSGPVLVMLHASPLSSAFLVPLIERFQGLVTVFAPDTPGYGASDPLPQPPVDLDGYADWLFRFLEALGIGKAGIYGSATGAQIAIRFARNHPDLVEFALLENAVHFSADERERILHGYFPDIAPRADGRHLRQVWEMSSRLFQRFPWFDDSEEAKVSDADPPLDIVQATALSYLVAGEDYARAYRLAFNNEDARNLQAVSRPTRVIRWQGSILRRHAAQLDAFEWPPNIRMVHCEAGQEARYAALQNALGDLLAEQR